MKSIIYAYSKILIWIFFTSSHAAQENHDDEKKSSSPFYYSTFPSLPKAPPYLSLPKPWWQEFIDHIQNRCQTLENQGINLRTQPIQDALHTLNIRHLQDLTTFRKIKKVVQAYQELLKLVPEFDSVHNKQNVAFIHQILCVKNFSYPCIRVSAHRTLTFFVLPKQTRFFLDLLRCNQANTHISGIFICMCLQKIMPNIESFSCPGNDRKTLDGDIIDSCTLLTCLPNLKKIYFFNHASLNDENVMLLAQTFQPLERLEDLVLINNGLDDFSLQNLLFYLPRTLKTLNISRNETKKDKGIFYKKIQKPENLKIIN